MQILKVSTVGMAGILNEFMAGAESDSERARGQKLIADVSAELQSQNPRFDAALFAYGCGGPLPPKPAPVVHAKPGRKPKGESTPPAKGPPSKGSAGSEA